MKSWHRATAVGLLGAGLLIAGVVASRRPASPEASFTRISDRLICRCGCGQHLNGCNMHPCGSAYPMRDQIRAGLTAGKGEDQIVQEFVAQMGPIILAAPPASGFGLAAWIMPIAALLLGLIAIYRVVRNLHSRKPLPATKPSAAKATPADVQRDALLRRYAADIEKDLEREA